MPYSNDQSNTVSNVRSETADERLSRRVVYDQYGRSYFQPINASEADPYFSSQSNVQGYPQQNPVQQYYPSQSSQPSNPYTSSVHPAYPNPSSYSNTQQSSSSNSGMESQPQYFQYTSRDQVPLSPTYSTSQQRSPSNSSNAPSSSSSRSPDSPPNQYVCTYKGCGASFKRSSDWHRHERGHEGHEYKCPTCGSVYKRSDTLKRHVLTKRCGFTSNE